MFDDDPDMQKAIAEYRARPAPEEKPFWWHLVQIGLMLLGAGALAGVAYGLGWSVEAAVYCGALAGMACGPAVLGYWPRRYRYSFTGPRERERIVLWIKLAPVHRALCALAVPLLLIAGAGLAWAKAEQAKEGNPARPTRRDATRLASAGQATEKVGSRSGGSLSGPWRGEV